MRGNVWKKHDPDLFDGLTGLLRSARQPSVSIAWCVTRFGADGSGFLTASGIAFTGPDARLYADERVARLLALSCAEAFRQGVAGYAQDLIIQGRPWPFAPRAVTSPMHIVHGALDTLVPLAHSRHTAEVVPGSTLRVLSEHGHFTILAELPTMASALVRSLS